VSRTFWFSVVASLAAASPAALANAEACPEGDTANCEDAALDADSAPRERDDWREPNYVRSIAETATAVLGGAAWYWIERDRQVADWDFPSLADRFSLEIFVTDNNPFAINHVWHTVSGTTFHLFARSNDLGMVSSMLVGLGGSLSWEYGVEYRERISVNDIIFTAAAGVAGGEFLHWLGRYLQQERDGGIGNTVARWTVGLPQSAHDAIDGRGRRGPTIEGQLRASYGIGYADASMSSTGEDSAVTTHSLRVAGELVALEGYMAPGRRSGVFRDANFTSAELSMSRGSDVRSTRFASEAFLAGWRRQALPEAGQGIGSAFNLGTAIGVRYRNEKLGSWYDRVGFVHFPGAAIDADFLGDGWRVRGKARLSLDYGGLHAHANEMWRQANPDELGKTILAEQGYYYGWGVSTRLGLEVSTPRFTAGASAFYGYYDSDEGLDRQQENLTVDQIVNDSVLDLELWLRGNVYGPVFLEARASTNRRSETLEDLAADADLTTYSLDLGARL
jgi:hypothetical protein